MYRNIGSKNNFITQMTRRWRPLREFGVDVDEKPQVEIMINHRKQSGEENIFWWRGSTAANVMFRCSWFSRLCWLQVHKLLLKWVSKEMSIFLGEMSAEIWVRLDGYRYNLLAVHMRAYSSMVTVGSHILAHQMTAMQQTGAFVIFMLGSQTVNSVLLNTTLNYVISQHYS